MGYVSGYGTPRGTRQHWGNGDGRFLYPPLAAAVPGQSGAARCSPRPSSSIRWEMLREGVEDYEYLYRLRELLGETQPAAGRNACSGTQGYWTSRPRSRLT